MATGPGLGHPDVRFEVLPLGSAEQQAAALPAPVRLTVTCSPKHGPDHSVAVGARLRALGHVVTVHVAARMVRDRVHLDELLAAMAQAGIDDMFLIGGDAETATGDYASASELLEHIAGHPHRPAQIGIAAYPEGHPAISDAALTRSLAQKSATADYVTTQMCFDPDTLLRWVAQQRSRGFALPVLIGMPGRVGAARLLEMSARIGVGTSVSFVRKQRGLRSLFGLVRRSPADRLHAALAPHIGDPRLGIAGFHYFTFNQLSATDAWHRRLYPPSASERPAASAVSGRGVVSPEESTT